MAYESTSNTIKKIYGCLEKKGVSAYLIGGISAAIQTGSVLYRQNDDVDLMVNKNDLQALTEALNEAGYVVEDKRGILTGNRVDKDGKFIPCDHELNADTDNPEMLGIGIFVYERKDGEVILNSYAFDERVGRVVGSRSVMPEELFDLMYSDETVNYFGTNVKSQSKAFTYLSKSTGNRPKDRQDADVLEPFIGKKEKEEIERIKQLQNRVKKYSVTYNDQGLVESKSQEPTIDMKVARFVAKLLKGQEGLSEEEKKGLVLGNEQVKKLLTRDVGLREIMKTWEETSGVDLVESVKKIAHDYYFVDKEEASMEITKDGMAEIAKDEEVIYAKEGAREALDGVAIDPHKIVKVEETQK